MKNKKEGLYPYTLQPIALNMTDDEFKSAQLALFEKSASTYNIKSLRIKEWIVIGITIALAICGLIFLQGYSTIIFWLMLIGVVVYLLLRTLGLKWYMKREFEKQVSELKIPDEMYQLKLGVQSHGLIMAIPASTDRLTNLQMRGMNVRQAPMQQGVIAWSVVTSWDETEEFLFVMFEAQGQKGSQIIPKRLQNQGLPVQTIIKHLSQVKTKGMESLPSAV